MILFVNKKSIIVTFQRKEMVLFEKKMYLNNFNEKSDILVYNLNHIVKKCFIFLKN